MYESPIITHRMYDSRIQSNPKRQNEKNFFQDLRLPKIVTVILEFFGQFFSISSLHGFPHLADKSRHIIERIIWLALVVLAIYGAYRLSSATWTRYQENPTVISMERDRFSWNTSFPAATICPAFKLDDQAVANYIEQSNENNKTLLNQFIVALAEANYFNLEKIPKYEKIPGERYLELLLDLAFKFKPSVTNSGLSNKKYDLIKVVTEMGICYSFNTHLAIYSSPDYWKTGNWKMLEENETFYVNPLDGEVFANIINMSTGYQVYIHGPYEVPDIASKNIESPNGYFMQLYLTGLTIFSSPRTVNLGVNQRKCRFHYESNLKHSPAYSYVLCRMECRISLSKKLCGCIPHFYRKLDGEKVCDVSGLHCLSQYKERLTLLKGECSCLPNCDEVNFFVEALDTREWFLGSNLQWGLKEYPKMRLRRDVIFGFTDLLVYIGGMAGLFLGCSVLSFIEIIYFFTIRLFWYVVKYRKDTLEKF